MPLEDTPGELRVEIDGARLKETLTVRARQFPEEMVTVAPELAEPSIDKA